MNRTRKTKTAYPNNYQQLEARNLLATITVDTLLDVSANDGLISLREAIVATSNNAANFDAPAGDANGDQIVFSPALAGQTITLNSSLFDITDDLIIRGNGITIDAAQNQRIFRVDSSEVVGISNIGLTGGRSEEGGAIRFSGGGTLRLTNVELFENSNAASSDGGAIFAAGGTLVVNQSEFRSNTAFGDGQGGAIFLADQSATAIIVTSTFDQNIASAQGAAISAGETDQIFIFEDSEFTNNDSGGIGGAIATRGNLRIGRSSFVGNSANIVGGAVFATGPRLTVANTIFEDNSAFTSGGAISTGETIAVINSSGFRGNSVTQDSGGAIYARGPLARSSDGTRPSSLIVRGSSFQANSATLGGAIASARPNVLISSSFIGGNTASGITGSAGGGLFVENVSSTRIFGTTFQNNSAPEGSGGAISTSGSAGSNLEVADSTFTVNVAGDAGGAIFTNVENASVFKSDFTRNRASTLGAFVSPIGTQGGAIHAAADRNSDPTNLVISGGVFNGNNADRVGGALSVGEDVNVFIRSAIGVNGTPQFLGNEAFREDGGAVFSSGNLRVRDAVFSDNQSRNGAGLFLEAGSLSLIDSEVNGNEARARGGGLFVSSGATFFEDSPFADNTAPFGPDADIFDENA